MTPDQIHFGQAGAIHAARQTALDAAFLSTPERFVRHPKPPQIPTAVWINPPKKNGATPSLNSKTNCLKVVDTFRPLSNQIRSDPRLRSAAV